MADTITGASKALLEYRQYQEIQYGVIENLGQIDHDLSLVQGTSEGQINSIYYGSGNSPANVDLSALEFERMGYLAPLGFLGAGSTNIKGLFLRNTGNNDLYVNLPFVNYSGNFVIPASGESVISSAAGWYVTTGNTSIAFSGSTGFDVAFLGTALPLVVSALAEINFESKSPLSITSTINFEYAAEAIKSDGVVAVEYLEAVSRSGQTNIEYGLDFAADGTVNIENQGGVEGDGTVLLEFTSPEVDGGTEFLRNKNFYPGSNTYFYGYNYQVEVFTFEGTHTYTEDIPNWQYYGQGTYNSGLQKLFFWYLGPTTTIFRLDGGYIRQTISGLDLSKTYRLGFNNTRSFNGASHSCKVKLYNSTGVVFHTESYSTSVSNHDDVFDFTIPTTTITIEFESILSSWLLINSFDGSLMYLHQL